MRILTILFAGVLLSASCNAQGQPSGPTYDFVVAADGSGDFTKVQDAIDAVPHLRKTRTNIFIKPGVYKEKLSLAATKTNISFIGEDAMTTILTYDDYASKHNAFGEEVGTSGSSSFFVYGDGFEAENITFENSSGPIGQAVAVRVDGDKVKFTNCRFLGHQDTLYPHGKGSRQYYKNCYIEGDVDFIFGWSTAVFEDCEIFCKRAAYITAASTEEDTAYGFVFKNCKITGTAEPYSMYLGRPWRPFAKTVFMNCDLGNLIKPEGWHNWGSEEKEKSAFYAEYQNTGESFKPDERANWSHQLTADQAKEYSLEKIFGDWNPNE
mgnify:CR=1 FL=1